MKGTLDMLILRPLMPGPAHRHQIARHIQRTTEDVLQVEHGSLYPALHRLERKGRVSATWETPESGKQRSSITGSLPRAKAASGRALQMAATGCLDWPGDGARRGGMKWPSGAGVNRGSPGFPGIDVRGGRQTSSASYATTSN